MWQGSESLFHTGHFLVNPKEITLYGQHGGKQPITLDLRDKLKHTDLTSNWNFLFMDYNLGKKKKLPKKVRKINPYYLSKISESNIPYQS